MNSRSEYKLLDFGENEKLESVAGSIVRRETPSASGKRGRREEWELTDLRCRNRGASVHWEGSPPRPWELSMCNLQFALRPTPTGQIGVFPEQAVNWSWIADCHLKMDGLKALNLFGYTGGTTMALAQQGAQVVHVDAAKSVVNWARQNAALSGMEQAPIRWIVEDALTFVQREIKRGNQYEIVVADPPSFGRGPGGESWKIQRDLRELLEGLSALTVGRCQMGLISCHTTGINHLDLESLANESFGFETGQTEGFELAIEASTGKRLPSGHCFRWINSDGRA